MTEIPEVPEQSEGNERDSRARGEGNDRVKASDDAPPKFEGLKERSFDEGLKERGSDEGLKERSSAEGLKERSSAEGLKGRRSDEVRRERPRKNEERSFDEGPKGTTEIPEQAEGLKDDAPTKFWQPSC